MSRLAALAGALFIACTALAREAAPLAEDPKIDLTAESTATGERSPGALLPLATACIEHAR